MTLAGLFLASLWFFLKEGGYEFAVGPISNYFALYVGASESFLNQVTFMAPPGGMIFLGLILPWSTSTMGHKLAIFEEHISERMNDKAKEVSIVEALSTFKIAFW